MATKIVLCDNDEPAVITIDFECPVVLTRFLDNDELNGRVFKAPNVDELGRLLFCKKFGICRENLLACISFLRNGHVANLNSLVQTMEILGGSRKLDEYVMKKRNKDEAEKVTKALENEKNKQNPMNPPQDADQLFDWAPAAWLSSLIGDGRDWSATELIVDSERLPQNFWFKTSRNT